MINTTRRRRNSNRLTRLENEGMLWKLARVFHFASGVEIDDLFQEASIAYLKALETHDPNKGKITTHAWWVISNHLKNYIKEERKHSFSTCEWTEEVEEEYVYTPSNYLENLPEDAYEVAKIVLRSPILYITRTQDDVVSRLKNVMEQHGWPRSKTVDAINVLRLIYS